MAKRIPRWGNACRLAIALLALVAGINVAVATDAAAAAPSLQTTLELLSGGQRSWGSPSHGVSVVELSSGTTWSVGGTVQFNYWSAAKVWFVAAALERVGPGPVTPLAYPIFHDSNNVSAGTAIDLAGGIDAVNDFTARHGMAQTCLFIWYERRSARCPGPENVSTSNDAVKFMADLWAGKVLDRSSTTTLLDWLTLSEDIDAADPWGAVSTDELPPAVRPTVRHKEGAHDGYSGNSYVAIVDIGPEPYAIALSMRGGSVPAWRKEFSERFSCEVYRTLADDQAWDCAARAKRSPSPLEGANPRTRLVALDPVRVADSRAGLGLPAALRGGETVRLARPASVPPQAVAVLANLTATDTVADGFLVAYPTGTTWPLASNLNWSRGQTAANTTVVRLASDGSMRLGLGSDGPAHVIVDITGYFLPRGTGDPAAQSGLQPFGPARALDTREDQPLGAGATIVVDLTRVGVPPTATAVTVNLTAVSPAAAGWASLFPADAAWPGTSSLNYTANDMRANNATVAVSNGRLNLLTSARSDYLLDVTGYWDNNPARADFVPLTPRRAVDTRRTAQPVPAGGDEELQLVGDYEALHTTLPVDAVALNVTAIADGAPAWVSVYPAGSEWPGTSTVNLDGFAIRPNGAHVGVGDGAVALRNGSDLATHVVVDLLGFYTPPLP